MYQQLLENRVIVTFETMFDFEFLTRRKKLKIAKKKTNNLWNASNTKGCTAKSCQKKKIIIILLIFNSSMIHYYPWCIRQMVTLR